MEDDTMRSSTKCLLGFVMSVALLACVAKPEAPPDLDLAADPSAAETTGSSTPKRGQSTAPMGPSDASTLPPAEDKPSKDQNGNVLGDAGSDAASVDAGPPYKADCKGYIASQLEHEANDTAATANNLVFVACAGINTAKDVDFYTFDSPYGADLTLDPGDDATMTVKTPSGKTSTLQGISRYLSNEQGRFTIDVRSPGQHTQTYLVIRN
jgi:hypothetical protein